MESGKFPFLQTYSGYLTFFSGRVAVPATQSILGRRHAVTPELI
jgi:hypothetical protein